MSIQSLFGANHCLPLFHMAKSFIWLEETKELINKFFIGYMIEMIPSLFVLIFFGLCPYMELVWHLSTQVNNGLLAAYITFFTQGVVSIGASSPF